MSAGSSHCPGSDGGPRSQIEAFFEFPALLGDVADDLVVGAASRRPLVNAPRRFQPAATEGAPWNDLTAEMQCAANVARISEAVPLFLRAKVNMSLRIGRGHSLLTRVHFLLTVPISIFFILSSTKIDPRYRIARLTKLQLGFRMLRNTLRIPTGSSFKVHLAMALKLFELPPDRAGAVVECGSWKGGSAANLSLVCQLTGRTLEIFDSFAGLPPGEPTDREAQHYRPGDYAGSLDEVRENLGKYGALDCCHFNQGWFHETLPTVNYPIALAFLDVDYEASLDVCVRNIWPHLIEGGCIFVDECATLDYVSLFYSESWWRAAFDQTPPGLIGAGTGLALGEYYIGPWSERSEHPLQHITTGAYTQKGMSAYWAYRPTQTPAPSEG